MNKLKLLAFHAMARMLGIHPTYTVKFLPLARKRTDVRGRAVANADSVGEALALFDELEHNPSARKEKTDGFYYLEIEAREGLLDHFRLLPAEDAAPVADDRQGGLLQGLSDTPADGPAAANPAQAAAHEAQGAIGAGTNSRYVTGIKTAAQSGGPVGEMSMADATSNTSLDQLGRR